LITNPSGVYASLIRAQALRAADPADHSALSADGESVEHQADANLNEKAIHSPIKEEPSGKLRGIFKSFGKLLYEQRAKWPNYIGILLSSMAVGAGTPIQAWLFAKALGVFLLQGNDLRSESQFWGLMWFALAGGVGLAYLSEGWIGMRVQYYVSAVYKSQYLKDMLYQKLTFFDEEENAHGSLSSRISSDAKQLEELLGINLALMLSAIFNLTGCVIISLVFGWKLGLISMSVALPIMIAGGCWKYKHEVHFDKMNAAVFQ
jgi:hypothetical protein